MNLMNQQFVTRNILSNQYVTSCGHANKFWNCASQIQLEERPSKDGRREEERLESRPKPMHWATHWASFVIQYCRQIYNDICRDICTYL